MAFNFISFELTLFIVVLFCYSGLRKKRIFPINLVRNLVVYITPSEADFDVLRKTSVKERETMTGKKNKYDLRHTPKQAKFPMRTMTMGEELLKYCSEFFADYDFLFMLFHVSVIMFVCMSLARIASVELGYAYITETNLTYYLTLCTVIHLQVMLCRNTFALGWLRFTDQTKMQFLVAIKSFFIVWVLLLYTDDAVSNFIGLNL